MRLINLRKFYCILAVVSILAATQSMLFPRKPQASSISSEKMKSFISSFSSNGKSINPTIIKSGHSDYEISHSPIFSFKINSNSTLFLVNAQVRDRADFGISFITDSVKFLKLDSAATQSKHPPFSLSQQTKAGNTFQTCFVAGNSSAYNFGINQEQLSLAVDQVKSIEGNLGLKRFFGLRPSRRYQCMLVTLKSTLPRQESYQVWVDLINKVQITFSK